MPEPVTTTLGLAAAKAASGKAGSVVGQRIWSWARGNEAKQLVRLLKKDHPAAAGMLLQPDVIGELWLFAETGALDADAMTRALRPLTDSDEDAEALTEAIRSEQWRTIREERRTHFELLVLRDDLQASGEILADQIVERVAELLEASRARLPKARQLPAAIDLFVDRVQELENLAAMLRQPATHGVARIVSISGMPGVGKSTVAIKAARDHMSGFDAGVLYVDLRGPGGNALTAGEVAGRLLSDLGVGPESQLERSGQVTSLRSLLAEVPVVLVLDNAESEDQVRDLIPANSDSVVIITSSTPLAGLGQAHLLPLQTFGQSDAVELLTTFVGQRATDDPAAAAKIADACDGLPLAISVVGARLRRRPNRSLKDTVAALDGTIETIDDPKESLRATLSAGLAGLSADARRTLLLIAALDLVDLSQDALAAVSGTQPREARRVIEELEDRQLLGSAGLHQLVRSLLRQVASEELTEDDLLSARDRRVQWLVTSAQPHISDLTGSDHGS
jgi:Mrp family chromosome partitioning ATPase